MRMRMLLALHLHWCRGSPGLAPGRRLLDKRINVNVEVIVVVVHTLLMLPSASS